LLIGSPSSVSVGYGIAVIELGLKPFILSVSEFLNIVIDIFSPVFLTENPFIQKRLKSLDRVGRFLVKVSI
jgi:hypothetical protein